MGHMMKMNGTAACVLSNLGLGLIIGFCSAKLLPALMKPSYKKKKMKLTYFDIPALGEPIRLLLELGGFDWEDCRVQFKDWAAMKPRTKWGQMPILEMDGLEMTQTKAIVRFLAPMISIEGIPIYPADPLMAYKCDELIETFEDVRSKLSPTFSIKDQAEKEAARAALFKSDGACTMLLVKINQICNCTNGKYLLGDSPTIADLWAFFCLSFLRSGFWDGLPTNYLDRHTKLADVVNKVAAIPQLKAYYGKMATSKPQYRAFLPK